VQENGTALVSDNFRIVLVQRNTRADKVFERALEKVAKRDGLEVGGWERLSRFNGVVRRWP
jgi:hypothetical protein